MKRLLVLVSLAAMATTSHAHFLWAVLDAKQSTVKVGLTENPGDSPLPLGARAPKVSLVGADAGTRLKESDADFWLSGPAKGAVAGAYLDYGVLDRSAMGRGVYWLYYYAKSASTLEASQIRLGLPVELTAAEGENGTITVSVLRSGQPAPGAEVSVSDDETAKPLISDANGQVTFPKPTGPIAVRCLVTQPASGTQGGLKYTQAKRYCTLAIGDFNAKKFTAIIQEAFGDRHEVVGKTQFIQTLMAGKLTKPQLAVHLQQRALIHEELDRVLKTSPSVYGPEQQAVLTLLKQDMAKYGIAWPEPNQATPLTQALIDDIRRHAESGPYFALGVFHVYYGGITHGGRIIGSRIEDCTGADLAYYLKSDGYTGYVKQVNHITDPAAQQEVVAGGLASYEYIMASNNDPVFRSEPVH